MNKNTGKVFDKDWFAKHQRILVWLINNWLGRFIFRYRKMGHYPTNKIVGISPNSITEFVKFKKHGRVELRQHFFSRNEYARKLYFVLLPMWWAMHAWDILFANNFAPQLNFGFDTLTQYPASIGAGNPIDGSALRYEDNSTWAGIRDGAGNYTITTGIQVRVTCGTNNGTSMRIVRGIICFDTSELGASAVISATVLSLISNSKVDNGTAIAPDIDIYTSTPAATNALAAADYSQVGTTSQTGSPITYANFVADDATYNDFTFNATGRGNVSKVGISKFGARNANYDVANSAPTWSTGSDHSFAIRNSETAASKPKLVVTYTLSAVVGAAFLFNFM